MNVNMKIDKIIPIIIVITISIVMTWREKQKFCYLQATVTMKKIHT